MGTSSYRRLAQRRSSEVRRPADSPLPKAVAAPAAGLGERSLRRLKRWTAAALLYPLLGVTVVSLVEFAWRLVSRTGFWRSESVLCFALGCLLWALLAWAGLRGLRPYIFGHELSHLLVAKLFGGRIFGFSVSAQGGFVETDKSNTWITLAPYLLPFYSCVLASVFLLLGTVVDLRQAFWVTTSLGFKPVLLFNILLGMSWWFHVMHTAAALRVAQTDLQRNGEFFSVSVIVLCNIAVLLALYLCATDSPWYEFKEWMRLWMGTARWLLGWLA